MKSLPFFFCCYCIILLSSCDPPRYAYSPSEVNIPFFQEKGESKFSTSYSDRIRSPKNRMNNGFDIQAAYAITNHLAVTADMYKRWEKDIYSYYRNTYAFDSSVVKYKRGVVNIGFGYFFPTNRKQTNFINVYAGIGSGRMKVYDNGTYDSSVYNAAYYTNFFQWYIHPAFTFMPYRKAFLSVGTKFIFVNYYDVHTNYNQSQLYAAHLNVLQNRMRSIFQPSVNMQIPVNRSGWMFINWGFALSLFGDSSDGEYVSRFANLSAGLTIDFLKYKKRNKKASSRYQ